MFRDESLFFMVVVTQDDVLGSRNLVRERDKLKEKREALERENSKVEEELVELQKKAELADSW